MQRRHNPRHAWALTAAIATTGALAVSCGGPPPEREAGKVRGSSTLNAPADPGFGHVHGLGLNRADGMLYAATHFGVWRLHAEPATQSSAAARPKRIADRWQDTMGFTVAGPDTFYGSGHPDLREDAPPHLGFIVSTDRAQTWQSISLPGQADFHDLAAVGTRVYGYDATGGRLLASNDSGRTWQERPQQPVEDLTVDPGNADGLLAITAAGLLFSRDAGMTFGSVPDAPPLVAVDWLGGVLAGVDAAGDVWLATTGRPEGGWRRSGSLTGATQAFTVAFDGRLFAADDHGVKVSIDSGRTWTLLADYDGSLHE